MYIDKTLLGTHIGLRLFGLARWFSNQQLHQLASMWTPNRVLIFFQLIFSVFNFCQQPYSRTNSHDHLFRDYLYRVLWHKFLYPF